ncbi:pyroglutamyl peptidase [Streptomyces sp. 1331.2]|uniref:pyroglutamyl peptidase n=1 Tax=Streptomyces sp. 1331.2 TaxID=1938835 RepID=UPI000BD0AA34|nr:pyroglutamyl peptidase [Streptomyces sp. 1331.2]SOB79409.1 Pyrrolidone-carboxylate peptidase (N-terminal pyroglutamyl peptidase) [Streptomyces sp. 1331.2]
MTLTRGTVRRPVRRTAALAAALAGTLAALLAPAAAQADPVGCRTNAAAPTDAEQARLQDTRTAAFTERSGLSDLLHGFPAALCTARTARRAERIVDAWGRALWQAGVDRAQGRRPSGELPARDDRPLYWTRLAMTVQLADWQPAFAVDRTALRDRFEDASRGLDGGFGAAPGVRRIFVSGFDPFGLDAEPRRANPSGAAVLQLTGQRITLADGSTAEVRAVVLPVRYGDFDRGVVERAFGPHLRPGPQSADLITSISQGYPGLFTLEAWAGRARSADPYPDNVRALSGGTSRQPVDAPDLAPGPQFIRTTLPTDAMTAVQQPYPVLLNTPVTEIPAGATDPVDRPDGPTPGSRSVAGGGGGYLSNEVAYRSNLLRLTLAPDLPGGHLHTPVLTGLPADQGQLTAPEFEQNQAAIADQVRAVLSSARL